MRKSIIVGAFVALASIVFYVPTASTQDTGGDKAADSAKKMSKAKKEGGPPPALDLSGNWYGRLDWSVHQTMPTGPQDWLGHADLKLYRNAIIYHPDRKDVLMGTLAGTETQTLAIEGCHGVTAWMVNARLTGTIITSAKKTTLNVMDRRSTRPVMASCGTARTGGDILKWPHFNEMFEKLVPSDDGNSYQSHLPITVSNGTGDCTLILQKSPE